MPGWRRIRASAAKLNSERLIWNSSSGGCVVRINLCGRPSMRELRTYDYAVVRVVPRVERGEFVNAGIILSCDVERILRAGIELDERALLALDPSVDLESVRSALAAILLICAGGA